MMGHFLSTLKPLRRFDRGHSQPPIEFRCSTPYWAGESPSKARQSGEYRVKKAGRIGMGDIADIGAGVLATAGERSAEERALAAAIGATPSIQSLLDRHAQQRPDACALVCNSTSGDWLRISWSCL